MRTGPTGLGEEALQGQVLRGGRSCASQWNVGAGASSGGKRTAWTSTGAWIAGRALSMGVIEQQDAQLLQPPACAVVAAWAWRLEDGWPWW
ncbi:MAG: hypothetical protein B7Y51_04610 [Burkholderiales bacterium 28-67-8]|nr:MAG: hypothetical protein B7Y51_04610 [Burkholderiales bacterium 28-67-8]